MVPADPPSHRKPPPRESEFVIPLHPQGNQFFIDTRLNGQTQAKLLLDTGATTVVLSEKLAQKLGFNYFHTMPQVKAETAGGTIWAPLLSLRKVRAGVAVVEEVEAIISPKLIKVDGLMGMTFLSQFKMKLDHASAVLTLKPLMDPPLYDGKPKAWWKQKFSDYRSKIRHFKRLAEDLKKKGDAKAFNVEKTVLHYEALYTQLKARGNKSGIPSDLKPGK
ncbi:MAG: retropepsin-like aspartic protease [Nitrospinota bacterium]|nr:retropepsin-like aspartic protease [Nitrospinota bacterium]